MTFVDKGRGFHSKRHSSDEIDECGAEMNM